MSKSISSISIDIYKPKKHNASSSQPEFKPQNSKDYIGLYNHGNTCYLNSLIQFLFMTEAFRSKLLQWKYDQGLHGSKSDCIPYQLQKLFARLQLKVKRTEETALLTKSFQWDYSQLLEQNDIQELCRVLFDAISLTDSNDHFINDLFEGELNSVIQCTQCNSQSNHYEKFLDLSLPVKNGSVDLSTLNKSFKQFLSIEKLDKENMYQCDKCNMKVIADRFTIIDQLPKILFIHLKRFEYDYQTYQKRKITSKFSFPMILDMKEIIPKDETVNSVVYELYSVIVHSGTAQGGHYYSLIKSFKDSKWYCFDDSNVYESSIEEIEQTFGNSSLTAYILGYKQKVDQSSINKETLCFDINNELLKDIEAEEAEYLKLLEEEKERMSYLNLKFVHGDKHLMIQIKKCDTVKQLKQKAFEAFDLLKTNDERDIRIKVLNANGNKIVDILKHDSKTLEEHNVENHRTYGFEIKKFDEAFEDFDPDSININVALWKDEYDNNDQGNPFNEAKINYVKISINRHIPYDRFCLKMREIFEIKINTELLIMKKNDYGVNNFSFVKFEPESKDFFGEEMPIYVEGNNITETGLNASRFQKYFESQMSNVFAFYNLPLPKTTKKITIKSYAFEKVGEINPKKTIKDLKELIGKELNLSIDAFIMKKNSHNGVELKHLEDLVEKYTSRSMNVYIEYGKPVKTTDIKISFQLYEIDQSCFALFPYKLTECGKYSIDCNWTIKQLKDFANGNQDLIKLLKIDEHQSDTMVIRQDLQFKPGKIYNDSHTLKELSITDNTVLIIQFLPYEIDISPNLKDIQMVLRYWDPSNWTLSSPIELFVTRKMTLKELSQRIIASFPRIELLLPENIVVLPIVNEIYLYMNEIEKRDFYSLEDFNESSVENFPLMIGKDGYMLIIKDLTKIPREPIEKERDFYCKKTSNNKETQNKRKSPNSTFINKKTFNNPILCSKMPKIKEKPLVIKVANNSFVNGTAKSTNSNTPDDNFTNEKPSRVNAIILPNEEI